MKFHIMLLMLFIAIIPFAHADRIDPEWGDPVKIDPAVPPSGIHVIQILLENQSLPLMGTGCRSDLPNDKRTLQHRLALTLGYAIDNKRNHAVLSGGCQAEKIELRSGAIINAWHCKLAVVEKSEKNEFISSSNIHFGVKKDTWEFIPESLRCT